MPEQQLSSQLEEMRQRMRAVFFSFLFLFKISLNVKITLLQEFVKFSQLTTSLPQLLLLPKLPLNYPRHILNMISVGEHVDRLDAFDFIAIFFKSLKVASKIHRITRNINDSFRLEVYNLENDAFSKSGPWRIDDNDIGRVWYFKNALINIAGLKP